LLGYGGHAAAAGLTIDESELERFRTEFCQYVSSRIPADCRAAELRIDAETSFSDLSLEMVKQMERLAPFGQANSRPVLCATGVSVVEPPRRIGGGGRHISLRLAQYGTKLRTVAFGGGDWAEPLARVDAPLAVAFQPVINNFRGRKTVELHLADWQLAGSCAGDL
jgi:single-stranded-DNA-specific exonuclease